MIYSSRQIRDFLSKQFPRIRFLENESATTGRFEEKNIIVFEYENIAGDTIVLKFFSLQHVIEEAQEKQKQDLLEELRIIKKFDAHPNVVKVYDANELHHDGRLIGFYITMEKFEGTLSDLLKRQNVFDQSVVTLFLKQMDRVLYTAHYELDEPIVHSDIKPANIGIRKGENGHEFVLMDFDVSVILDRKNTDQHAFTLSNKASLKGITLAYAPPEQVMAYLHRSGDISNRVDVYAVGAIGMQMLTGCAPVKDANQMYYRLPFEQLPQDWRPVFERLCAPDAAHRSRRVSEALKTKGKNLPPPGQTSESDGQRTLLVRSGKSRAAGRSNAGVYMRKLLPFFNPAGTTSKWKLVLSVWIFICIVALGVLVFEYASNGIFDGDKLLASEDLVLSEEQEKDEDNDGEMDEESETRFSDSQEKAEVESDSPKADDTSESEEEPDVSEQPEPARQINTGTDDETASAVSEEEVEPVMVPVSIRTVPEDAQVQLLDRDRNGQVLIQGRTDHRGLWQLNRPEGVYVVAASSEGYETARQTISVTAQSSNQVSLNLSPLPAGIRYLVDPSIAQTRLLYNGREMNRWRGNSRIEDLEPGTYQLHAEAQGFEEYTSEVEIGPGEMLDYSTRLIAVFQCGDVITDVDGNTYETVQIGDQCWMAENLKTSRYANGTAIPNVQESRPWRNQTTGAWVHYENNSLHGNSYGKLYNWHALNDERGLCPDEWRVPTDDEWTRLTNTLGSSAGSKLKARGTRYWHSPNAGATDQSGFNALPGGNRVSSGTFLNIGALGFWWSASASGEDHAWSRSMYHDRESVYRNRHSQQRGYSVRCIHE
ncbi:FISUMP domain-containing protein [Balneolaceae bacterium ANBcel3]|nr:FISUMP domain-containing protein [Balneolaceae bacterium ANBcel3]